MLVGIKKILIICSEEETVFLQSLFGNGEELGITLRFSNTKIEDALHEHPLFEECSNYMIVYGRSLIYGVDQTRFFQKAMMHKDRLTVLSLPRGNKVSRQKLCFDDDRKIICDTNSEEITTQYNYYDIPVVFCPKNLLFSVFDAIEKGSIADNSALKDRYLYTEVLDRGFVEITIDTWDDLIDASNFIRIVQKACGMNLYCLEEIAWRRGMISTEQLIELTKKHTDTWKYAYLKKLINPA